MGHGFNDDCRYSADVYPSESASLSLSIFRFETEISTVSCWVSAIFNNCSGGAVRRPVKSPTFKNSPPNLQKLLQNSENITMNTQYYNQSAIIISTFKINKYSRYKGIKFYSSPVRRHVKLPTFKNSPRLQKSLNCHGNLFLYILYYRV